MKGIRKKKRKKKKKKQNSNTRSSKSWWLEIKERKKENNDTARYKPWLKKWSKNSQPCDALYDFVPTELLRPFYNPPKHGRPKKHLLFPMISLFFR